MKTEYGIWSISKGKNGRVYINCNTSERIMHPDQLCDINGIGIYGSDNLKDLGVAIMLFEHEQDSIISIVKRAKRELMDD